VDSTPPPESRPAILPHHTPSVQLCAGHKTVTKRLRGPRSAGLGQRCWRHGTGEWRGHPSRCLASAHGSGMKRLHGVPLPSVRTGTRCFGPQTQDFSHRSDSEDGVSRSGV
jgi:hypothetical protein